MIVEWNDRTVVDLASVDATVAFAIFLGWFPSTVLGGGRGGKETLRTGAMVESLELATRRLLREDFGLRLKMVWKESWWIRMMIWKISRTGRRSL